MLSRMFRVGTTLVILGLAAGTALAQGGGGRGGRGGGMQRGTAPELLSLLATPEIRKEVKLSDEGFTAVDKVLKENDAARQSMFGGRGGGPGGPPGGAGGASGGERPADPERETRMKQMQQLMADGVKKVDEAIMGVLSDEQKKSLEQLKGAKFEFPESLKSPMGGMGMAFGGFGGGGFGGGRGSAPGAAPGGAPAAGDAPARGGRGGFTPPSEADMEKMRVEREQRTAKAQELLDEVLPPEGLDRLIGLYVQLRGNSTITGELPSKKLGLSEADITKINEAAQKAMQEVFQGMGGGRGNRQRPGADSGT